ncbi:MAG TPA: MFS transporter [Micrococcaceae bacterium]|jgi:MFS family permease|nr:MFS transporter [Micrococcaceae bacterium]
MMTTSLDPRQHTPPSRRGTRLLGRYGVLPQLSGRGFIPLGLFARLPLAMLTVGVLTLVTAVSHSYALGGFAAGAVGIGSAAGAPLIGYLADRLGQRHVLLVAAVSNALAITSVVVLTYLADGSNPHAGTVLVLAAAFVSGATSPQVGPLARVRWMALSEKLPVSRRDTVMDTALSFEGTADELTFVLGPALVGILASLVAPWLPLALAAVLSVSLVCLFAVHPTESAVGRHGRGTAGQAGASGSRINWLRVGIPVLGMVSMGTFFGATQTALIAFTGSFGSTELAGLLYSVVGLSSAGAALSVPFWPARLTHPVRWLCVAALMAGLSALLLLPGSVPAMVGVLFVLGIPVGPSLVTIFTIGGMVAPKRRLGTVMTALASGIVAGTAIGSSIAGSLAQSRGYGTAFLVPVGAALVLMLLGVLMVVLLRRSAPQPAH